MTISQYFRSDRRHPRLTLELPGREPITGVHLVFVSNVDPWTYLGNRPIRTNPGTSVSTGLGVFALTSMSVPTALRASSRILTGRARAVPTRSSGPTTNRGRQVHCSEPVDTANRRRLSRRKDRDATSALSRMALRLVSVGTVAEPSDVSGSLPQTLV